MDKLPFPVPSDPVVDRMTLEAEKKGFSSFDNVYLPLMLNTLKQGSGRLIRRETDTGLVVLLDSRAWDPRLHSSIVQAIPPGTWKKAI